MASTTTTTTTTTTGIPNYDTSRGIHYGVIPAHVLGDAWYELSTPNYTATCGHCGSTNVSNDNGDYWTCLDCGKVEHNDNMYGDEPDSITYEDAQYIMTQDSMGDVFVLKSPYYTYARECSPCAPNAGYITSQDTPEYGMKTYIPGPEWCEDYDGPLTFYDVTTNNVVESGT